jgi:hypothetical protein
MPVPPLNDDRPDAGAPSAEPSSVPSSADSAPTAQGSSEQTPIAGDAPTLTPPTPEQSPWWSAPAGKPFEIPDFAHELRALLAWLLPQPRLVPVRVKARRR